MEKSAGKIEVGKLRSVLRSELRSSTYLSHPFLHQQQRPQTHFISQLQISGHEYPVLLSGASPEPLCSSDARYALYARDDAHIFNVLP